MTRRTAIRKYYKWLHCGSAYGVERCTMTTHPLYPYRSGKMPEGKTGKDRDKAIRENCLICAGDRAERRNCPFTDCSLWEFRSGSPATRPIEGSGAKTQAHPYLTPPEGDVSPKPPYRLTFGDEEGQA